MEKNSIELSKIFDHIVWKTDIIITTLTCYYLRSIEMDLKTDIKELAKDSLQIKEILKSRYIAPTLGTKKELLNKTYHFLKKLV